MNINEVYDSGKNLKADDLKGPTTVTIEKEKVITFDDDRRGSEQKVVLSFVGAEKRLVLNKTNASIITGMFGEETTAWIGKEITIYPTQTEFGGDMVPCIRVLPPGMVLPTPAPVTTPQQATTEAQVPIAPPAPSNGGLNDEIPF